jgi:hypothetical protein
MVQTKNTGIVSIRIFVPTGTPQRMAERGRAFLFFPCINRSNRSIPHGLAEQSAALARCITVVPETCPGAAGP